MAVNICTELQYVKDYSLKDVDGPLEFKKLTAKNQLRGCEVCAYWNAIAGQFSSVSYVYLSVFIFCHKILWTRLEPQRNAFYGQD